MSRPVCLPLLACAVLASAQASAIAAPGHDGKPHDPPGLVRMTAEQEKTVGLRTSQARLQPITQPVPLPGVVGYDPGHVAVLRPFEQALIVRLLVQPGDTVVAGQTLIELDMPGLAGLQQNLAAAAASLREARAGVGVASAALDRAVILSRDGSMARAEADRRRLVVAQAVAAEQTERARATMLQTEIDRLAPSSIPGIGQLRAPLSGVVVSVGVTQGEAIGTSTDALTIADLHTVMVIADIPESEATKIAIGDPVVVGLAGSQGRTWDGRVASLGAQLDPRTRTLPARIRIANPDLTLRAGLYVDVRLTRSLDRTGVVVPSAAVQSVADKTVVFTPDGSDQGGDRFQAHDVKSGIRDRDTVEIRSGLEAGQTVVTAGSFQLKALLRQSMLDQG